MPLKIYLPSSVVVVFVVVVVLVVVEGVVLGLSLVVVFSGLGVVDVAVNNTLFE